MLRDSDISFGAENSRRLQNLIYGIVATLIVTVTRGVIVLFIEHQVTPAEERKLTYEIFDAASFTGSERALTIQEALIENNGDTKLSNIVISAKSYDIIDYAITHSSEGVAEYTSEMRGSSDIRVKAAYLLPNESIRI